MTEMFVKIRDKQLGPYSYHELKQLVEKGEFKQNDLVFDEDTQEWAEAATFDELSNLFLYRRKALQSKTVIAIGGGKGGVGKTVLTASIGIGLAKVGYRVVIVDADLGGANLHTCMGILEPKYTFYHFYTLQKESLADIMLNTPIANLRLISGACGTLGLANPRYSQKLRFISNLRRIDADYILLDLGAGSSFNVIDFFLAAKQGIVVTTPEPMAIQETFNFVKIALMRKLMREFKDNSVVMNILEQDFFVTPGRMGATLDDIADQAEKKDAKSSERLRQIISSFHPSLILNMVHAKEEVKEGAALLTAAKELLSIQMNYLGYVDYDDSVRKAVKELRPFVIDDPKSKASRSLARLIAVGFLGKKGWKGFTEKRKVIREISQEKNNYPSTQIKESETICSVQCFYWGDCEYQNGGYLCPVRHLDPIFRR